MADYSIGIKGVLNSEGFRKNITAGLANDPADSGGLTLAGITRKNNPNWEGWKRAEELAWNDKNIASDAKMQQLINEFYRVNFWDKIKGDNIKNQEFANTLISTAVLEGMVPAVKRAQQGCMLPQTGRVDTILVNRLNTLK
jgi:lysozyme family protein